MFLFFLGNPLRLIRTAMRTAGAEVLKKYLASRIEGNVEEIQRKMNPSLKQNKAVDFWDQIFRDFLLNFELIAKGQQIKEIHPKVFTIDKLKTLDLSKNEITYIDREIGNLQSLKKLRMSENSIEEVPLEINYLVDLVEIEFRQNKLSDFLQKLSLQSFNLRNILTLDLSVNKFSVLPKCILAMNGLKVLNMAYNSITNIDFLFNGDLKSLEVLDFSNNKIENISDEIFRLRDKLGFLNLEYNNLSKFPTVVGFMELKSLKLDGNPLKIIKRTIIEKGTVAILDFLRNRHVGEPPEMKNVQQRAPEGFQQQIQPQQPMRNQPPSTKMQQNEVMKQNQILKNFE